MSIQWRLKEGQREILLTGREKGRSRWRYRIYRRRNDWNEKWGLWKYESRNHAFGGACKTLAYARGRCEADLFHTKGRMRLSPPEDTFTEQFNQGFVAAVAVGIYEGNLLPEGAKQLLESVLPTVDWATISAFDKAILRKHRLIPRKRKSQ